MLSVRKVKVTCQPVKNHRRSDPWESMKKRGNIPESKISPNFITRACYKKLEKEALPFLFKTQHLFKKV